MTLSDAQVIRAIRRYGDGAFNDLVARLRVPPSDQAALRDQVEKLMQEELAR